MADINVTVTDATQIHVVVSDAQPINVELGGELSSIIYNIFIPDEDGQRIKKMYVKNGKLKVKYEDGD